ncbi:hypothetical protein GGF46_003810 [Coemansia sp. RSA 552]|nr:hypothetical protein GGF46_003810 [Coemansia sp. RSA 552]
METANSVDAAGDTCPLVDRNGLSCPVLCVKDLSDCPAALEPPTCPDGEELCGDGECHASCASIENPCLCGAPRTAYRACPADARTVAVREYDPSTKQEQVEFACAKRWGLVPGNATFGSATGVDDWTVDGGDRVWGECPEADEPRLTFTESYCVAFYCIVGAEALLYALWHAYKGFRERGAQRHRRLGGWAGFGRRPGKVSLGSVDNKKIDIQEEASERASSMASDLPMGAMLQRGFDGDLLGLAMFWLTLLTTAGWVVLLAVIVADYYGAVYYGVPFGLMANSNTSTAVFIFIWHLAALWMVGMLLCRARLRNYFRIECALQSARVIQIEQRREAVALAQGARNPLARLVSRMHSVAVRRLHMDIVAETSVLCRTDSVLFIEHRCTRYVYSKETEAFEQYSVELGHTHGALRSLDRGLSEEEARGRRTLVGENFIHVAVPSFLRALVEETMGYFYLYQLMCMAVWFQFNYFKMAFVQFGVIILSALVKVVVRQRSEHRIKRMAEQRTSCRVRRPTEQGWEEVDTAELVPGDVVLADMGMELMFDGCVLSGEAVVDESSLTGEAMPVRKLPLKADYSLPYNPEDSSQHALSAGTRVVQCSADQTLALVLRTRTATEKGRLVQRILFPTAYSFIFDEEVRVAMLLLLAYGGVGFALTIWWMGHDVTSWLYGTFVISEIASVLLPVALVVGQTIAADRLRRQKIYCVDLPRVIMAGKVRVFCFDKTGTLTSEGLEWFAAQPIKDGALADVCEAVAELDGQAQMGLASCHAVAVVDKRPIGNPVDVEQFRASGWAILDSKYPGSLDTLEAPTTGGGLVHVLKRFEFEHARQSMSVAVQDASTGSVHVFVKGSFERIRAISNAASVPSDYDTATAGWAKEGCYVLALAHRNLGTVDMEKVAGMSREELEAGCDMAGLLLFRNKLKHDTAGAIAALRQGGTRTVMITGDTALTGIYIARQCGMVMDGARVVLGSVEEKQLVWRDTATDEVVPDIDALLAAVDLAQEENSGRTGVELAVTAAAFDCLVVSGAIRKYLPDIRIFSRMSPQGKVEAVNLQMERAVTAMCGDGGNDCGALRAAHVGLALSGSEASIVSPFSTSQQSIWSCVTLLREGRAGLATSLAGFKFLVNYGVVMSTCLELVQFYFSVIVSEATWIFVDSFIAVGLSMAVTQAQTARTLAPSRPTARLLGAHTLASIWGQTLINLSFMFGAIGLLFAQEWFRCHEFDSRDIDTSLWWLLADNYEAEVISIMCLFQFTNAAAVYNFGYRYRRAWITNYLLVVLYAGFLAVISVLALANPNRLSCLFRINCGDRETLAGLGYSGGVDTYNSPMGHNVMPRKFRWTLWAYGIVNMVVCLAFERLVVLGPVGRAVKRWWRATRRYQTTKPSDIKL